MGNVTCAVCGEEIVIGAKVRLCDKCCTPYHPDCAEYNSCCATYACNGKVSVQSEFNGAEIIPYKDTAPSASSVLHQEMAALQIKSDVLTEFVPAILRYKEYLQEMDDEKQSAFPFEHHAVESKVNAKYNWDYFGLEFLSQAYKVTERYDEAIAEELSVTAGKESPGSSIWFLLGMLFVNVFTLHLIYLLMFGTNFFGELASLFIGWPKFVWFFGSFIALVGCMIQLSNNYSLRKSFCEEKRNDINWLMSNPNTRRLIDHKFIALGEYAEKYSHRHPRSTTCR